MIMKKVGVFIISVLLVLLLLVVTLRGCNSDKKNNNASKIVYESNAQVVKENTSNENVEVKENTPTPEVTEEVMQKVTEEITPEIKNNSDEYSGVLEDIIINGITEGLIEVDESTIPYSGVYNNEKMKIADKRVYTDNYQLYYLIILVPITENSTLNSLGYYVSYSSYSKVNIGDILDVEYELFSNNIISINLLEK